MTKRWSVLLVLVVAAGCSSSEKPPAKTKEPEKQPPKQALLPADVEDVVVTICSGCHSGGPQEAPAGLSLESKEAYAAMVGPASRQLPSMKLIEPGDPAKSYFLLKMNDGFTAAGGKGVRMPKGGTFGPDGDLTEEQTQVVEQWIQGGAPSR